MKRAFDLLVAAASLLILSPVMAVIAGLVRRKLGSPILFKQVRPGLKGEPFTLIKFRTMNESVDEGGRLLDDEARLTEFGASLRATSLDELPELWNVVRGDMSIVGPRPLLMEYLPLYSERQRRRHEVRPGLTGWAQVNGRNATSWPERLDLDVWYVDHASFGLDLKIIAMTLGMILRREGISQEGQATMELFGGNEPGT